MANAKGVAIAQRADDDDMLTMMLASPFFLGTKFARILSRIAEKEKPIARVTTGMTVLDGIHEFIRQQNNQQLAKEILPVCFHAIPPRRYNWQPCLAVGATGLMWQTAMSANCEEVVRKTLSLKDKLIGTTSARVQTRKGTDIVFDYNGRDWLPT
jgi:hypothetical protein